MSDFYSSLPILERFSALADPEVYEPVPADWCVVCADVKGSTDAIRLGNYRSVNIVGVSVITAVRNAYGHGEIPYVFGGDGATLCVPVSAMDRVRAALAGASAMALDMHQLELRVGVVPITDIEASGHRVLVARYRVSEHVVQAAFSGGGVDFAESLIKDETKPQYRLPAIANPEPADLAGLECRWNAIPSPHGETISLLIKALPADPRQAARVYTAAMSRIEEIYGDDDRCRPVTENALKVAFNPNTLAVEARARGFGMSWVGRLRYGAGLLVKNLLGWFFMTFRLNLSGVEWGEYRRTVVRNTDFKKFDDALRQVLSGNRSQRLKLEAYLETRFAAGELAYGIHWSPAAILTCLIASRSGEHFHFVDGSDGGYATAAVDLKRRLGTSGSVGSRSGPVDRGDLLRSTTEHGLSDGSGE